MTMLCIYNTLTRTKEAFRPIEPGKVRLYVCGMTAYDYCHIGHGRIFTVFDTIVRFLRFKGYDVNYVRNITDIDDKIIHRANQNNESIYSLTSRMIAAMDADEKVLGVVAPNFTPRATAYIDEIITMIETLIASKFAYRAENGDIYFEAKKFEPYGEMAQQTLDKLRAGIRVEVVEAKHDPLDFVLWKLAKPDEPKWDSPWGEGRPGWHIECSAMANNLLGKQFDIHGGGLDLQFPHHQNELAQSEAANGCKFVNYWMHVGYVTVDKEKMSKSLHNFFTIREVLKEYDPEIVRYFMLASHYRSPINYSQENLSSARSALERLYASIRNLSIADEKDPHGFEERYITAMDDDFNTPVALSILFDMVREINRLKDEQELAEAAGIASLLKRLGNILGILQNDPTYFLQGLTNTTKINHIEALIRARNQARVEKNWSEADKLRDELQSIGIIIEDGLEETTWRRE
jgi:cysteinyl-tRNA synthetase